MYNFDEEKGKLIRALSEQYSQSIINMEEYERILEYINKIETRKEINIIKKIILENNTYKNERALINNSEIVIPKFNKNHLALFSWRNSNVKSINGNGGKYTSLFGVNRIIVDNLPKGRTVLNINSIFGLTEIVIPENIKIINKTAQVFSGVFTPNEINKADEEAPELYIIGKVIFGNITVKTLDELKNEIKRDKDFGEKYAEKIMQNMYDKISKKK